MEQAVSLHLVACQGIGQSKPSFASCALPTPNHATKGSRLQVFLLKAKGGLVWGATIYVLFS